MNRFQAFLLALVALVAAVHARHLTLIDEEEPGQILVGGCAGVSPENFAACCEQNPLDPACASPIRRGCLGLVGVALEECCLENPMAAGCPQENIFDVVEEDLEESAPETEP